MKWIAAAALVVVVVLTFVFFHVQNERRYNDCLTAHGIANPTFQRFTFNPCHKTWP